MTRGNRPSRRARIRRWKRRMIVENRLCQFCHRKLDERFVRDVHGHLACAVCAERADVAGEMGQGGEAFGVGAQYRDTEQLHALFVLIGVMVLTPASEAINAAMRITSRW